ncbi:MAG: hypothetical protein ACXVJB_10890 [Mucilaginibacter sp.]
MFGIITIAHGEKRYIEMAKMLALSLKLTNQDIKRAVISDAPQDEFRDLFDTFIPYNPDYGKGLSQKLYLDQYSPFDETLFIDSDCLVVDSLDHTLELCRNHSFAVFGDQITSGDWYMDVVVMCKQFNLSSIPLFNGGTYYFKKTGITAKIYEQARKMHENYSALGFHDFRGSINEEPLIAVAMAVNNVEAVDDKGAGMRTPIGLIGPLEIDVLNRKCAFNKEGVQVQPAIVHFSGSFSIAFHYKREVSKLKLIRTLPFLNKKLASFLVNTFYDVPYACFVFSKRILKSIFRKEKFDYGNALPVFSNQ